jgi:FMN-dependent NADH-azoreductase
MRTLLHIDSSPDLRRSLTRKLTAEFVAAWRGTRTRETVIHRDLVRAPVALPGSDLFEARTLSPGATPSEGEARALGVANALTDEVFEAEALVLGVPVTALSVPASFKAWLEQVSATGRAQGRARGGALKGRKVVVVASMDAGEREPARAFHEAYLRQAFAAFGIADVAYVPVVRAASNNPAEESLALEEARVVLRSTLERWNAEENAALREELAQAAA